MFIKEFGVYKIIVLSLQSKRKRKRMKSIKEKAEENLEQNKDEILCVYDRYAGFYNAMMNK